MTSTSATGGYLLPTTPEPLDDQAIDVFFASVVAGVTGLPGTLVRPRWQPEPPNIPDYGTTWAAVGVIDEDPDDYAYIAHDPNAADGLGQDNLQRHETLTVMSSFYGPKARSTARLFRDGMSIPQNREALGAVSMGLVRVDKPTIAPVLVAERWLYQIDVPMMVRREVFRSYSIQNLASAVVGIVADTGQGIRIINITVPSSAS